MKINILGTEYTVLHGTANDFPSLAECDGFTDTSSKEIIIEDMTKYQDDILRKRDITAYSRQVLRHEIIHAFLAESGLDGNGHSPDHWEHSEEMVDWIAIQGPKIYKVWEAAGAL